MTVLLADAADQLHPAAARLLPLLLLTVSWGRHANARPHPLSIAGGHACTPRERNAEAVYDPDLVFLSPNLHHVKLQLNTTVHQFAGAPERLYKHMQNSGFDEKYYKCCFPTAKSERSWFQEMKSEYGNDVENLVEATLNHFHHSLRTFHLAIHKISDGLKEKNYKAAVYEKTELYLKHLLCEVEAAAKEIARKEVENCLREEQRIDNTRQDIVDYEVVLKYEPFLKEWVDIFAYL